MAAPIRSPSWFFPCTPSQINGCFVDISLLQLLYVSMIAFLVNYLSNFTQIYLRKSGEQTWPQQASRKPTLTHLHVVSLPPTFSFVNLKVSCDFINCFIVMKYICNMMNIGGIIMKSTLYQNESGHVLSY